MEESNRAEKKQTIIEKIKKFFEKYFGINSSNNEENNEIRYDVTDEDDNLTMVAEDEEKYKIEENNEN